MDKIYLEKAIAGKAVLSRKWNITGNTSMSKIWHNRLIKRPQAYDFKQFQTLPKKLPFQARSLLTIAIETSCDDTSVAVLEKHMNNSATLHFNSKITSDNRSHGGIHPIVAHESHQKNLASLLQLAMQSFPLANEEKPKLKNVLLIGQRLVRKPDFVTVTRGPGMRASLITGIDTAKGLSVGWQVPLLGVNHMQAHALTPRLVSALNASETPLDVDVVLEPRFPFMSLLVSGGHTMLVHSRSIWHHEILAETNDVSLGDMLDKVARNILPASYISSSSDVMYGRLLEEFAYPSPLKEHEYNPPKTSMVARDGAKYGYRWKITPPYLCLGSEGGFKNAKEFSFSGIGSIARSTMQMSLEMPNEERRCLAIAVMTVAFEHLGSRVLSALKNRDLTNLKVLVVSGGVASNKFLRTILRSLLDSRGFQNMRLDIPPPELCTDNAAMIAWTGVEMFEAGLSTDLHAISLKEWSIDPSSSDGGILGASGWEKKVIGS